MNVLFVFEMFDCKEIIQNMNWFLAVRVSIEV